MSLCVDIEYAGCNRQGKGERLFTKGKNTKYMNDILQLVKEFQSQFYMTEKFTARLDSLGLFTPMSAELKFSNGKTANIDGFMLVNLDTLKNLPENKLKQLIVSDDLALIYMHLNSLVNIRNVLNPGDRSTSSKKKSKKKKTDSSQTGKMAASKAAKKSTMKKTGKKVTKKSAKKATGKKAVKKKTKKAAKKKKEKN